MPPAPDDLCVLADLKAWLNIQTSAEDALLQSLITRGSLQMLRWMNRDHIIASGYTENRDGNDALFILPRNFPLISVSALIVNGVAIVAANDQVSAGFVFDSRKSCCAADRASSTRSVHTAANISTASPADFKMCSSCTRQDMQPSRQTCSKWQSKASHTSAAGARTSAKTQTRLAAPTLPAYSRGASLSRS